MAYRRGGDRGDQRPPYGHGGATGAGGGARPFVWPPPPSTPRPVPAQYHQGAYGVPAAVYREPTTAPGQPAMYRGVTAPAPQVSFSPAPPAVPATIRAPPPSPTPAPSSTPAPRQRAQGASTPAPEPAPASSALSPAALAKEVVQKLFASEIALAPPAAAAQGTAAADADDASSDVDLAPVSKKGLAHPARPGLATVGKKVMIRANHFLVKVADNNLFHYNVAINPESKSRQTNREVLNELIKLHGKTALGGKLPAYDGRKSLYTAGSLPFESEEFVVMLVDPGKKEKERAEREYKITIRIAGRTDLYHLQQFLCGRQRDMPQETIRVLDVVLQESPSWNYVTVSRSFFSTTFGHRGDICEGLECWRGYYQSLRPTQMGLSLNIDISATSFFKPVTVIKFVEEFLSMRDTSRPLSDRDCVKIKKALRGVRMETTHQQDQIRIYKITGVTPIPMSQLIFPIDDQGTRKTVVQYFWDKYNYSLKYGSWPCLQAGSDSRPVYLPMEVCKIVEGQRYSKKLNDRQVTNILRATCKRPQEREQSIRDMVVHNKYADDRFAQEFGISVSIDLVTVPVRVLPPPMLKYHDSGREKTCAPSVGQWNMINKKMINGGTIDNWTCLNFSRMRPEEVQRFCMDLTHMCNATGMVVNPCPFVDVKSAAPNHIENALRDVHRRAMQMPAQHGMGNQLQLLIVILPEVSGSYGKIKRVCETDIGIVSQCCLPKHASRPNKKYLENVALKINVKVGGRNTVLERAFVRDVVPYVSEVPTIIFGADVTHPPPGEDSASSSASVAINPESKSRQTNREVLNELTSTRKLDPCLQVFVDLDGPTISMQINTKMTVRMLVIEAFKRRGMQMYDDVFVLYGGDVLDSSCSFSSVNILKDTTFIIRPRCRAGQDYMLTNLKSFEDMMKDHMPFYKVTIPPVLQKTTLTSSSDVYVVFLSQCARFVVHSLIQCISRLHSEELSLNGQFKHSDFMFWNNCALIKGEVNKSKACADNMVSDYKKLGEILELLFKCRHLQHDNLPAYLGHLISVLKNGFANTKDHSTLVAYISNHMALVSFRERIKKYLELESFYCFLEEQSQVSIHGAIGDIPDWGTKIKEVQPLYDTYTYRAKKGTPSNYGDHGVELLQFQRNFLSHPNQKVTGGKKQKKNPIGFTEEEAEAALCYYFPETLANFIYKMLTTFVFPTGLDSKLMVGNDLADPNARGGTSGGLEIRRAELAPKVPAVSPVPAGN